ncbi:hypothetical protein NBRC116601_11460 [Cognatishimia sp. WU-CL00825]
MLQARQAGFQWAPKLIFNGIRTPNLIKGMKAAPQKFCTAKLTDSANCVCRSVDF